MDRWAEDSAAQSPAGKQKRRKSIGESRASFRAEDAELDESADGSPRGSPAASPSSDDASPTRGGLD